MWIIDWKNVNPTIQFVRAGTEFKDFKILRVIEVNCPPGIKSSYREIPVIKMNI